MPPGRTVVAGPVEASALGNIAMQMVATEASWRRLPRRGEIIEHSFPVERFEPDRARSLERATIGVFMRYLEPTCV